MQRVGSRSIFSLLSCGFVLSGCGGGSGQQGSRISVASIIAESGTPQSAALNAAFAAPLVAQVRDQNGNPVSGVMVTFNVPSTGASAILAGNVNTATTGANGEAASPAISANNTAGAYTITAMAVGASIPANFNLTNTGPATSVAIRSGYLQSTVIDTAFSTQLSVEVMDAKGDPVSGVTVTFDAPTTGASAIFAGGVNTAVTDSGGIATSAKVSANNVAGFYAVSATAAGLAVPADDVQFALTNLAGPPAALVSISGSGQSAATNTAFITPLAVQVVDAGGNLLSTAGMVVTFSGPNNGPTVAFSGGVNTAITNASGQATSTLFSANAVAGPYQVIASASGLTTANFSLTNVTAGPSSNYVFYLGGLESARYGTNSYGLAGSVSIDVNGYVLAGEQDYKDDWKAASPQPSGDSILGGALSVSSSTGQGTLTLVTNDPVVGANAVETLGVQFVNAKHALIVQFDGSATSSGSMDLQVLPSTLGGGFSFTVLGTDAGDFPIAGGGVFSVAGGTLSSGVYDYDDLGSTGIATVTTGAPFSGTISPPDSFGRGTILITNTNLPSAINYYVVGPEALRLIVVGPGLCSGVGSAFGQGASAGNFSNASLGNSIFGVQSNANIESYLYAAAGMIVPNASGSFQGVADDNEEGALASDATISGSYNISSNGYGRLTISPGQLGDVSVLGIYMIDPTLNLSDPNNTTSGLGGALVADLDTFINGTGVMIPQTDTSTGSFSGNYAFETHNYNAQGQAGWELDSLGQGSLTNGIFDGLGFASDPSIFFYFGSGITNSGVIFSAAVQPDTVHAGRYTLTGNGLSVTLPGRGTYNFQTVFIYQASGQQLLWIDEELLTLFLGSFQQQGSLVGIPGAH
jgi:hypothetical protein